MVQAKVLEVAVVGARHAWTLAARQAATSLVTAWLLI